MHRKRSAKGTRNLPRGKKAGRTGKKPVIVTIDDANLWLVKNFISREEKRALIKFYRDRIDTILSGPTGTSDEDYNMRVYGERIKFITEHF